MMLMRTGANPYVWPTYRFPYNWQAIHQEQSATTPFVIAEFQGGSGEGWFVTCPFDLLKADK